jgi:DNA mismatch repair protein MutS2
VIGVPDKEKWMDGQTEEWIGWSGVWNQLKPLSIFGREYKQQVLPFNKGEEQQWLEEIEKTKSLKQLSTDKIQREHVENALTQINDPRLFIQLLERGEAGTEADWFGLKQFLWESQTIFERLAPLDSSLQAPLKTIRKLLGKLQSEQRSFSLEDHAHKLKHLRQQKVQWNAQINQQKSQQREKLEQEVGATVQGRHLFVSLKNEELLHRCTQHNELKKERETPFEVVFSVISSLEEVRLLNEIEGIEQEIEREEKRQLQVLAEEFVPYLSHVRQCISWLAIWDWRWTKWKWFLQGELCWPAYDDEHVEIKEGRYLPLENKLRREGKEYTPLAISMSYGLSTIVGSNMGGKSIAIKTAALLIALAHYALPVPAASCKTPLFHRMVVISGDQQNVEAGLSTFGAEMVRLAQCIEGKYQLVFMDELARGTNPTEGEALALAIGSHLAQQEKQMAVMITHFSILSSIQKAMHYRVIGLEEDGLMNYSLVENTFHDIPRQAIIMAKRLGLPNNIIEEAEELIRKGEEHGEATIRSRKNGSGTPSRSSNR